MDVEQTIKDASRAAGIAKNVIKVVDPLTIGLEEVGGSLENAELTLRCPEQRMEYTTGLTLSADRWKSETPSIKIPLPLRFRLFALSPYKPLDEAVWVEGDKLSFDRHLIDQAGPNFRFDAEYRIAGQHSLSGLVYSSSPNVTIQRTKTDEFERYWLHSELKTTGFLRDIYRSLRVEGVDVAVSVTVSELIKRALSDDLKFEIMMQANLTSSDRNVQAKALSYRRVHPIPKFHGNLFKVAKDAEEMFQPDRFRRFVESEGKFRINKCLKGPSLASLFLPMSLPESMIVLSSTDLTRDDPAKSGTLIYRKSAFAKRLRSVFT